ncbi:MAG: hypothetical protein KY468_12240 [Armatimonadetes bacterium]|nr:hypothetical protein [Armatimonadota bacterium]
MHGLSGDTLTLVERFFPSAVSGVITLLSEECGNNLPFLEECDEEELERIRFAVLKLCKGDLDRLYEWIDQAQTDWRDVLVAAGFGESITAHRCWFKAEFH